MAASQVELGLDRRAHPTIGALRDRFRDLLAETVLIQDRVPVLIEDGDGLHRSLQSCDNVGMKLYLAGPMFTPAERTHLDSLADRLENAGHQCFVPHRQDIEPLVASTVFAADSAGLRDSEAMVAWLDGPIVDDGTACEIGIFSELVRTAPKRYRGIVGLATDWRAWRRRDRGMSDGGVNFFVGGAILEYGRFAWSIEDVEETLSEWR